MQTVTVISPKPDHIPALRALWKEAFGDPDAFLDIFFSTAFSPERCLCLLDGEIPVSAVYWMDMQCCGQKMAYLYAVATAQSCRGRGYAGRLLQAAQETLKTSGYSAALLVPQKQELAALYERCGYRYCTEIQETDCTCAGKPLCLSVITAAEYDRIRNRLLPPDAVQLGAEGLLLLGALMQFYAGDGIAMAGEREGEHFLCREYLGDVRNIPGVLQTLGCSTGSFRMPGAGRPFAMLRPLSQDAAVPGYLGFAFD